jgi:Uma2 family endonuclease
MPTKTTMSWEQFLTAGEEWQRWELVDGEVEFMSPVNFRHEYALSALIAYLFGFCRVHPEWACFASNVVFTMASGNWRMPDASLVRKERFPGGTMPLDKADFAPDVAFEIHSPSDRPGQIQAKRKEYQESGVIQVWIDLEKRLVELIYPDRPPQYFQEDQPLIIDTLPGFFLDLTTLYSMT